MSSTFAYIKLFVCRSNCTIYRTLFPSMFTSVTIMPCFFTRFSSSFFSFSPSVTIVSLCGYPFNTILLSASLSNPSRPFIKISCGAFPAPVGKGLGAGLILNSINPVNLPFISASNSSFGNRHTSSLLSPNPSNCFNVSTLNKSILLI